VGLNAQSVRVVILKSRVFGGGLQGFKGLLSLCLVMDQLVVFILAGWLLFFLQSIKGSSFLIFFRYGQLAI
jgi:hypothetical protein